MMKPFRLIALPLIMFSAQFAHANVEVVFVEGAPKDKFVVNNIGKCDLKAVTLNVDLSDSAGRLIFDTTASGAGVEVFQPFEVVEGNLTLVSSNRVNDGDNKLSIGIDRLKPQNTASFSIDVDDTLAQSELGNIRVSDSEMQNASVTIMVNDNKPFRAKFNQNGRALISMPSC